MAYEIAEKSIRTENKVKSFEVRGFGGDGGDGAGRSSSWLSGVFIVASNTQSRDTN